MHEGGALDPNDGKNHFGSVDLAMVAMVIRQLSQSLYDGPWELVGHWIKKNPYRTSSYDKFATSIDQNHM